MYTLSIVVLEVNSIPNFPFLFFADLVVTSITPFAARIPYKADAGPPFNILILSISSSFKSASPLGVLTPPSSKESP